MTVAPNTSIRGKLLFDEPMSKHTSWRLGGPADRYFVPADVEDLQQFLAGLEADIELVWVGLGSNLLVRDGGIRGQVIAPLGALKRIHHGGDGLLWVDVGVSCSKLSRYCQKEGLAGAEFFAGIPGTVGGALAMNAGAFGGETWSAVRKVLTIDRRGVIRERERGDFDVGYRHVGLPGEEWFLCAGFEFARRAADDESDVKKLLRQRNATQPIGLPSCGSVFKNPPGSHAAKLIDEAGLKGFCLGSACVSDKHANFIISNENTTSADVEALIEHIRKTVAERFGVELETEVRIIGEKT